MIYIHCILSGSTVSGMSIPAQVVICHVAVLRTERERYSTCTSYQLYSLLPPPLPSFLQENIQSAVKMLIVLRASRTLIFWFSAG